MLAQTIPYGRSFSVSYYGHDGSGGKTPDPSMKLSRYHMEVSLSPENSYDAMRNFWVATTIANTLKDDQREFFCTLIPEDDVFTITSSTGDVLQYKLYNDVLVKL